MKYFLAILLFVSTNAYSVGSDYIDKAFHDVAKEIGVSESLLRAVCWVETGHRPHLYRHADAGLNDHAFGICQVLYSTANTMGLKDENCLNDFSEAPISKRKYENCKLFGPRTNIRYAARFLKSRLDKYNGDEFKAIASYNSGSYKRCRDGWLYIGEVQPDGTYQRVRFKRCIKGGPINFYYINRVLEALEKER